MVVKNSKPALNDRVPIENLNDWTLYFRGIESPQDIAIPPKVKNWKRLTVAEIDAQVKSGNVYFCGTDGIGTNASIKILDDNVRKYVFSLGDESTNKQQVLDVETVKALLAINNKEEFTERLKSLIVTDAEKRMIGVWLKEIGIDDIETYKINAIKRISGYPIG